MERECKDVPAVRINPVPMWHYMRQAVTFVPHKKVTAKVRRRYLCTRILHRRRNKADIETKSHIHKGLPSEISSQFITLSWSLYFQLQ
jgi:hypothetical protein